MIQKNLKQLIEEEIERFGLSQVIRAREELSDRYRQAKKQRFMTTEAHRLAYLATRLPATHAAVLSVLEEIKLTHSSIQSVLDLGAGPGTATWAAADTFVQLNEITLIEKDADLIRLGKRLAANHGEQVVREANWQKADLEIPQDFPPSDLVILSYSIGELTESKIPLLLDHCWNKTKQVLAIIEPGTPVGFERIRLIRKHLISKGANMLAPCPHSASCPMSQGDWCHFSARVERTSLHRQLKQGKLGYEDEKFAYIVFSKTNKALPQGRVLRHPLKRSGHIPLTLCTSQGVQQKIVSKRTPGAYKLARQLEWGSAYNTFTEET